MNARLASSSRLGQEPNNWRSSFSRQACECWARLRSASTPRRIATSFPSCSIASSRATALEGVADDRPGEGVRERWVIGCRAAVVNAAARDDVASNDDG
jgi:hypothetical protein